MADSGMPQVGDIVADKYEIVELIGEGGMGAVFMATHQLTGKRVALKWMLPELAQSEDAVQRFIREAQAAGRIAHPNVVDIYDVGEHDGSYFLVMEYLHGEPLTKAMERGVMDPGQVVDVILPCLRGVAAAHRKGVVHRDLKPDNIFLCRNDDGGALQPKVLDFGISKLSGHDGEVNPRLTRTGAVMGTPYYMSPEQIRGSHDVDARCDVYAFGVILYEAMTGQVPFNADTYSALVLEIATGTPQPAHVVNPQIPEELSAIVMKAMAREPEDRYSDIMELGAALEPYASSVRFTMERMDPTGAQLRKSMTTSASTPFTAGHSVIEVPGRRKARGVMIGVAAFVITLGGAFLLLSPSEEQPAAASPGLDTTVQPPDTPEDSPVELTPTAEPEQDETASAAGPDTETSEEASAEEIAAAEQPAEATAEEPAEEDPKPASKPVRRPVRRKKPTTSKPVATETKPTETKTPETATTPTPTTPATRPTTTSRPGRTGSLTVDDF